MLGRLTWSVWFLFFLAQSGFTHDCRRTILGAKKYNAAYFIARGIQRATNRIPVHYLSTNSIWSVKYIKSNPRLQKLMDSYHKKEIGQSVRDLKLSDYTAEQLHDYLLSHGFYHQRIPLTIKHNKIVYYISLSGNLTKNKPAKDFLPHYIYVHKDGGSVRAKPWGIPIELSKNIRKQPHAVKGIVYDTNIDFNERTQMYEFNVNESNQAFKISEDGIPLPKSPSEKHGFQILYSDQVLNKSVIPYYLEQENQAFIDTIMAEIHIDLNGSQKNSYHIWKSNKSRLH